MTESNRQQRSAQPHRPGTGSVPVLFSLRNVQPNIVGGIANAAKTSATPNGQAEKSIAKIESPPAAAPAAAAAQPAPKTAANSNRSFNVVVGLLVIALCLLVIRNTQNSKSGANATLASNSSSTTQTALKTEANSLGTPPAIANTSLGNTTNALAKVDPFPPLPNLQPPTLQLAEQKKPDTKPIELGGFGTPNQVPSSDSMASLDLNDPLLPVDNTKDPISLRGTTTATVPDGLTSTEQNVVQAKPSLLLPSTKQETLPTNPTLSFPEQRIAMNPAAPVNITPNQTNSTEPRGSSDPKTTGESAPMDTGSSLTTRELIDIRNRANPNPTASPLSGQPYPNMSIEPNLSVSPVSNVMTRGSGNTLPNSSNPYQPIPNNLPPSPYQPIQNNSTPSAYQPIPSDSTILSGRSYPPLPQENPSLKVPLYEQSASSAAQSQMIRQPATNSANSSNRYPAAVGTQVPYTPVAPPQGGNPFGYPPGK